MKKRALLLLGIGGVVVITLTTIALVGGRFFKLINNTAIPVFAAQQVEPDPEAGLIVISVSKAGPAAEAGIVRGDILLEINDSAVNTMIDLHEMLADVKEGEDVNLTILHGDELLSFTLSAESDWDRLGLSLCCGAEFDEDIVTFELEKGKPLIVQVVEGSPAEEAGLKVGDLIHEIDAVELGKDDDFAELIRSYNPGDQIELEVERIETDERVVISIILGEHPEEDGVAYLGVQFIHAPGVLSLPLGDGDLEDFHFEFLPPGDDWLPYRKWFGNFPHRRFRPFIEDWMFSPHGEGIIHGIVISEILLDSPASEAGLQEGDIIAAINGEDVQNSEDFAGRISASDPEEKIILTIYRNGLDDPLEMEVILGEHPDKPGSGYLGIKIGMMIMVDHSDGSSRLDRWIPNFDRPPLPFHFEWRMDLPGSKDA